MKAGGSGQDWLRATVEQVGELVELRRALSQELRRLRRAMREKGGSEQQENCMAEIIKLSQVQMKLIPLEQTLRREMESLMHQQRAVVQELSAEDWNLLEDALERRRKAMPQEAVPEA